jgi:predicted transcriptional regulator
MAFWDKWLKEANKFKVSVEIPDDVRQQLLALAKKLNLSVDTIATKAVIERIKTLHEKMVRDDGHARAMDEAYAVLDAGDQWDFGPDIIMPEPPEPKITLPVIPSNHPCRYFDPAIPKMFRGGEVAGSCLLQGGKPCLYPANIATNCSTYFPKAAPTRAK